MKHLINKLFRSLALVTSRGIIRSVNKKQQAQASFLYGETKNEVPIYQQFGFKSVPTKDSGCVAICNGNRENLMIIATTDRKTDPDLKDGEVALFSGANQVLLKSQGIEIKADKLKLGNTDLLPLLVNLIEVLSKAKFPTNSGPQPLPPDVQTKLLQIKGKIDGCTF